MRDVADSKPPTVPTASGPQAIVDRGGNAPAVTLAPTRLGPYAVVRPLGAGGMASVYEGVHVGLGKRVAIKVLNAHLALQETTAARFVREGRAIAKVRHTNVVDVFDVGAHEGTPYLVMELLEGVDLAEYLRCNARLSLQETLDIMLPVIAAISAAHEAGIVHRDLKPANVFLARDRHGKVLPKVVDFGISTFMEKDGDLELTHTQMMLGTVRYMSAEQTRGAKYADARSDQYSLAVMLYLCTTGRTPYMGEGVYETIHAIRTAPFVPPSTINAALPVAFDQVIARAMAREPAARFPSVAELARALLPLAARRSSINWEREFPVDEDLASTRPDALGAAQTAQPPVKREDPTVMTTVSDPGFRPRVGRGVLAAVALVVLAVAVLGVVKLVGAQRTAAVSAAPTVTTTASNDAPPATATTTAPEPPPPAVETAPPSATTPAAPAKTTRPPPRHVAPPPPAAAPPPRAAPTATGNNGAPILE